MVAGCTPPPHLKHSVELREDAALLPVTTVVDHPSDTGAIIIRTDARTLDMFGGRLVSAARDATPDQFAGRAIVIRDAKNVTIRGVRIRGFKVAIYAESCPGLTIENCDVSGNYRQRLRSRPEGEHEDDWLWGHENDNDEWLRYGAGIYLKNCPGATIRNCRARDGQNGICLVNCDDATIAGNDMSFLSGWGLAMWRSNRCRVIGNRFDYCVRGYSHGVYARGQDSTGILVYEQCSDNVFAYNRATHGGDGFFLYAGHETTRRTGEGGCNRNLVYHNDFSHAVANGIEATFSDQNVFIGNRLAHCTHGIWAGYSRRSLIEDNVIEECANGISIEHGRDNRIFWNRFRRCRRGIALWWDDDRDLLASPYARRQGAESAREYTERNSFQDCQTAIFADASTGLVVNGSTFERCGVVLSAGGRGSMKSFTGNVLDGGQVQNRLDHPLVGRWNLVPPRVQVAGDVRWTNPAPDRESARRSIHNGPEHQPADDPLPWARARDMGIPATSHGPPDRLGTPPLGPLPGIPEGKQHLAIDEWGPRINRASLPSGQN
jgi:parallel beta-helix repeat protein